jgi:hypothetical protein
MIDRIRLPTDATIADVIPTLQNPEEYLRVVLDNMFRCKQERDSPLVRIGITGTGQVPYHRVSFTGANGDEELFGAFDGRHPFKEGNTLERSWSSATLTIEEVQELLGQQRGWRGPQARR